MAGKMSNVFALLLLIVPFWVSSAAALPRMSLHSRDDPSPLGGSDNKTDIGYCGEMGTATFKTGNISSFRSHLVF